MGEIFTYRTRVRYSETDQQGVVFNMHYLGYFDEAMNMYLDARGPGYAEMIARGYDVQLVHTEVDWRAALRWQDDAEIAVSPSRIGRTSFTLDFAIRRISPGPDNARSAAGGFRGVVPPGQHSTLDFAVRRAGEEDVLVTGRTVYVVVATDGSGKREIPPEIRAALEPVTPLF